MGGVRRRADWEFADANVKRGAVAVAGDKVPGAGHVQEQGKQSHALWGGGVVVLKRVAGLKGVEERRRFRPWDWIDGD